MKETKELLDKWSLIIQKKKNQDIENHESIKYSEDVTFNEDIYSFFGGFDSQKQLISFFNYFQTHNWLAKLKQDFPEIKIRHQKDPYYTMFGDFQVNHDELVEYYDKKDQIIKSFDTYKEHFFHFDLNNEFSYNHKIQKIIDTLKSKDLEYLNREELIFILDLMKNNWRIFY